MRICLLSAGFAAIPANAATITITRIHTDVCPVPFSKTLWLTSTPVASTTQFALASPSPSILSIDEAISNGAPFRINIAPHGGGPSKNKRQLPAGKWVKQDGYLTSNPNEGATFVLSDGQLSADGWFESTSYEIEREIFAAAPGDSLGAITTLFEVLDGKISWFHGTFQNAGEADFYYAPNFIPDPDPNHAPVKRQASLGDALVVVFHGEPRPEWTRIELSGSLINPAVSSSAAVAGSSTTVRPSPSSSAVQSPVVSSSGLASTPLAQSSTTPPSPPTPQSPTPQSPTPQSPTPSVQSSSRTPGISSLHSPLWTSSRRPASPSVRASTSYLWPISSASPGGISTNGQCGPVYSGQVCKGSQFGNCCSRYGVCGSGPDFCAAGCMPAYGDCSAVSSDTELPSSSIVIFVGGASSSTPAVIPSLSPGLFSSPPVVVSSSVHGVAMPWSSVSMIASSPAPPPSSVIGISSSSSKAWIRSWSSSRAYSWHSSSVVPPQASSSWISSLIIPLPVSYTVWPPASSSPLASPATSGVASSSAYLSWVQISSSRSTWSSSPAAGSVVSSASSTGSSPLSSPGASSGQASLFSSRPVVMSSSAAPTIVSSPIMVPSIVSSPVVVPPVGVSSSSAIATMSPLAASSMAASSSAASSSAAASSAAASSAAPALTFAMSSASADFSSASRAASSSSSSRSIPRPSAGPLISKRGLVYVPSDFAAIKYIDDPIWKQSDSILSWYYNYQITATAFYDNFPQLQFVPMLWGDYSNALISTVTRYLQEGRNISHVLGFNEPDGPFSEGGSNITPARAAARWISDIEPLKQYGIKLGAPAVTGSQRGFTWLEDWLIACNGSCNPDFMAAHYYGNFGGIAGYIGQMNATYPGKPVWITEYATAHNTLATTQSNFKTMLAYFDRIPIERYSYFGSFRSDVSNVGENATLLDQCGRLTDLGAWYLNYTAAATGVIPSKSACSTMPSLPSSLSVQPASSSPVVATSSKVPAYTTTIQSTVFLSPSPASSARASSPARVSSSAVVSKNTHTLSTSSAGLTGPTCIRSDLHIGPVATGTPDIACITRRAATDDYFASLPLPFNVVLFGTISSDFYISTNGFITLDRGSAQLQHGALPNRIFESTVNGIAMALWTDLSYDEKTTDTNSQGVYYVLTNTSVAVEWIGHCNHADDETPCRTQFSLSYTTATPGVWTYWYYDIYDNGASAAVGVQGPGYRNATTFSLDQRRVPAGTQVVCDTNVGTCSGSTFT